MLHPLPSTPLSQRPCLPSTAAGAKAEVAFPTEDLLGFLPTSGQGGCGAPNHVAAAAVEQPLTSEALPTPCSAGSGSLEPRLFPKRICERNVKD